MDAKNDLGHHISRKRSGQVIPNSEYDDFESFKLADFREKPENQVAESFLKAKIVTDFVISAEEDSFISQGKFQPNKWVEDERQLVAAEELESNNNMLREEFEQKMSR